MYNYIARRILIAIPIVLGITLFNFMVINLAPGSPLDLMIDPKLTADVIAVKKHAMGLDAPVYQQYVTWLGNLLQGNLGYSLTSFRPVSQMIGERVVPTLLLMGTSLALGLLIAVPIGVLSATRQYSWLDYVTTGGAFLGISIPNFFLGLGLIYVFSISLKLLPSSGMVTLGSDGGIKDIAAHMILPCSVLTVNIVGRLVRYVRAAMLDILEQDYLRTATAKGVHKFQRIWVHGFRNALLPVITVIGLEIPTLLGGAVVTEQIFGWPGIGRLTMDSILTRDYPTLMGLNLIAAVMVLAANLFTDIMYGAADPRIKYH